MTRGASLAGLRQARQAEISRAGCISGPTSAGRIPRPSSVRRFPALRCPFHQSDTATTT